MSAATAASAAAVVDADTPVLTAPTAMLWQTACFTPSAMNSFIAATLFMYQDQFLSEGTLSRWSVHDAPAHLVSTSIVTDEFRHAAAHVPSLFDAYLYECRGQTSARWASLNRDGRLRQSMGSPMAMLPKGTMMVVIVHDLPQLLATYPELVATMLKRHELVGQSLVHLVTQQVPLDLPPPMPVAQKIDEFRSWFMPAALSWADPEQAVEFRRGTEPRGVDAPLAPLDTLCPILLKHQRDTVQWMRLMERNIPMLPNVARLQTASSTHVGGNVVWSMNTAPLSVTQFPAVSTAPATMPHRMCCSMAGGLLATEMGVGKTLCYLAHALAYPAAHFESPFDSLDNAHLFTRRHYPKSRATLLLIPNSLMRQTVDELAERMHVKVVDVATQKKWVPISQENGGRARAAQMRKEQKDWPTVRIAYILTSAAFSKYSLRSLLHADLVIMSHTLVSRASTFVPTCDMPYVSARMPRNIIMADRMQYSQIHWHRIVVDECHQLFNDLDPQLRSASMSSSHGIVHWPIDVQHLLTYTSHYRWLVSGTPHTQRDMSMYTAFFMQSDDSFRYMFSRVDSLLWAYHIDRRTLRMTKDMIEDWSPPPILESIMYLEFSPMERNMYMAYQSADNQDMCRLMCCDPRLQFGSNSAQAGSVASGSSTTSGSTMSMAEAQASMMEQSHKETWRLGCLLHNVGRQWVYLYGFAMNAMSELTEYLMRGVSPSMWPSWRDMEKTWGSHQKIAESKAFRHLIVHRLDTPVVEEKETTVASSSSSDLASSSNASASASASSSSASSTSSSDSSSSSSTRASQIELLTTRRRTDSTYIIRLRSRLLARVTHGTALLTTTQCRALATATPGITLQQVKLLNQRVASRDPFHFDGSDESDDDNDDDADEEDEDDTDRVPHIFTELIRDKRPTLTEERDLWVNADGVEAGHAALPQALSSFLDMVRDVNAMASYTEQVMNLDTSSRNHEQALHRRFCEVLGRWESAVRVRNFMTVVANTLPTLYREECSICMDTFEGRSVSILPCAHYVCSDCFARSSNRCAQCRREVKTHERSSIMRVTAMAPVANAAAADADADVPMTEMAALSLSSEDRSLLDDMIGQVGTKLASVVMYIRQVKLWGESGGLDSQWHELCGRMSSRPSSSAAVVSASTSSSSSGSRREKFIIFSQFDNLLRTLLSLLDTLGVRAVICQGNGACRQRILNRFQTSQDIDAILLSSEHSASGANLTSARNIIFLDPANPSMEAQAIARAHRLGQTLPVHVARFLIQNTLEDPTHGSV